MRQKILAPDSITVANIVGGNYNAHTVPSLIETLRLPEVGNWVWEASGPYLDDGRNNTMLRALGTTDCEVVLFFDSDIAWEPLDVINVCTEAVRRKAVVGGLYYSPTPRGIEPIAYRRRKRPTSGTDYYRPLVKECHRSRPLTPLRCDGVGTGFMAIPRKLAEAVRQPMPQPWFSEPVIDEVHLGEDLAFCHLVKSMGYDVFVHRGVRVRHAKTILLDPNV